MKKQLQVFGRDMQALWKNLGHVSQNAWGEPTLGQHIDRLSEVIGNEEEVKNLMQRISQLEARNKMLDKEFNANQGKILKLKAKMINLEKLLNQIAENVSTLMKKLENVKG